MSHSKTIIFRIDLKVLLDKKKTLLISFLYEYLQTFGNHTVPLTSSF